MHTVVSHEAGYLAGAGLITAAICKKKIPEFYGRHRLVFYRTPAGVIDFFAGNLFFPSKLFSIDRTGTCCLRIDRRRHAQASWRYDGKVAAGIAGRLRLPLPGLCGKQFFPCTILVECRFAVFPCRNKPSRVVTTSLRTFAGFDVLGTNRPGIATGGSRMQHPPSDKRAPCAVRVYFSQAPMPGRTCNLKRCGPTGSAVTNTALIYAVAGRTNSCPVLTGTPAPCWCWGRNTINTLSPLVWKTHMGCALLAPRRPRAG